MKSKNNVESFNEAFGGTPTAATAVTGVPPATLRKSIQNSTFNIQNLCFGFFFICIILSGCGIYSFKEGAISPDVNTISIDNFYNESGGGPPNLAQTFTEKLKNYYQQNSRLDIVKSGGDWHLEGKIVSYGISPIAPQGEVAALTRLMIGVQVKFVNTKDEKASFDKLISFYDDFPQSRTLSEVENDEIQIISEKIVYDIFTATTSNW